MTGEHRLAREVHDRIYSKIALEYLPRAQPQSSPVAIITGGQPGAGKSGLTDGAKRELTGKGGYVLIDADEFRAWHPHYHALLREDDRTAANKTHADAGAWAARLGREAVATRRNVIFDQTSRDAVAVADLVRRLRHAGYRVELRVMAVHALVSEQRIHMRYELQRTVSGHGRFATKDNHDAAYAGVYKTVAVVEAARAVDAIQIYNRSHRVIYEAAVQDGWWSRTPMAAKVMDLERNRALSLAERAELVADYARIIEMLQAPRREATAAERATVAGLAEQAQRLYLGQALREGRDYAGLAQARRLLQGMAEHAQAQGLDSQARDKALELGREVLARAIERGEPLEGPGRAGFGESPGQSGKGRGIDR